MKQCVECNEGFFSGIADENCQPCFPNEESNEDRSACECVAGYFKNSEGSCEACPHGSYKIARGDYNCTECGSGMTTLNVSEITEEACYCGIENEELNEDRSACECIAGYFRNSEGSCEACPQGSYKIARGNYDCTECGSGMTTLGVSEITEEACYCSIGYGMVNGACVLCSAGKKSVQSGQERYCENCGFGMISYQNGMIKCIACRENEMTDSENSTSCKPKPPLETCDQACGTNNGACGQCYKNMTSCENCADMMSQECDYANISAHCLQDSTLLKCDDCITCDAACDWPQRLADCRKNLNSPDCVRAKSKYTSDNSACEKNPTWFTCILIDLKNRCENECKITQMEKKIRVPKHRDVAIKLDQAYEDYSLNIPMYTLKTEETIGLAVQDLSPRILTSLQSVGIQPMTMALECSPSGLQFDADGVTLTFHVTPGMSQPENLRVYYIPDIGLPQEQESYYNATSGALVAKKVKHFSAFVGARPPPQVTKSTTVAPEKPTRDMRVIAVAASVGAFLLACFFACMCLTSQRSEHMEPSTVSYYVLTDDTYPKLA